MESGFKNCVETLSNFRRWLFLCVANIPYNYLHSDGHSGATSAATFSVAAAPLLFFVTNDKGLRRCFF